MKKDITKQYTLILVVITIIVVVSFKSGDKKEKSAIDKWFPYYDFNAANFRNPSLDFGPYTRWWWPGNDVSSAELRREVQMFADNMFGGVEIQPITFGINLKGPQYKLDSVLSWDTPSFYEHVKVVMDEALKSGISVDIGAGSGWPLAVPIIMPEESMLTLNVYDTTIKGGTLINLDLQKFLDSSIRVSAATYQVHPFLASMQVVMAAKISQQNDKQVYLDQASLVNLTSEVKEGEIDWQAPEGGNWKVMAFYIVPDEEKPSLIASNDTNWVVNYLDSTVLRKTYDYLFGKRTGLNNYYGKPFRAIFNDSYKFKPSRLISRDFLSYFKNKRGYDISPWLAANIQPNKPRFIFSDEDWRLRYDYDLTVNELFKEQFLIPSHNWTDQRGLLHRTQAFGVKLDVIGASGLASVPEAEQLWGRNSEGFIKMVTSGAHLYNKPVIAQESFVFKGRAEMTTPQKLKVLADKSFAIGINQIVYHGTPYKYETDDYRKEGWSVWASIDISSNINESFPYWKNIKELNTYIARCQYALRAGKPKADVLIFYPFADFEESQLISNPQEAFIDGYFKGVEPVSIDPTSILQSSNTQTITQKWFTQLWPLINKLEEMGITWEYINDASLLEASVKNKIINVRGNQFEALIVSHAPYTQLSSANKIRELSENGAKILITGNVPDKQPGFINYKENDAKTKQNFEAVLKMSNCKFLTIENDLSGWITTLHPSIKFNGVFDFTRRIEREMSDGSRLQFIWNHTDNWQNISLHLDKKFIDSYCMNAEDGSIVKNNGRVVNYTLPPYGSILIYAITKSAIASKFLVKSKPDLSKAKEVINIERWNIQSGNAVANNSALFDWRTKEQFRYKSDEGIYKASFNLNKEGGENYYLDLGAVYFTADVFVNGKYVDEKIWAPYHLDISKFVQSGANTVEIRVMPTARNEFIGKAVKGDSKYVQFKGKENTLMPAGLIGPVVIKKL